MPDTKPDIVVYIPQLLSFLTGFFTAICAEPIRKKIFRPVLAIDFEDNDDYKALTPEGDSGEPIHKMRKAYYVRAKVTNTKAYEAENCKAYLINIQKLDENNILRPTIYCDRIPLAWSCQNIGEQYNGLNINFKSSQFVDIVTTRENFKQFFPQIKLSPHRYISIFNETGKFVFTIQVTASNASPKDINLCFEWNGHWDKFKIYQYKS